MVYNSGRLGEPWTVSAEEAEEFRVACELCDIAVANVSETSGKECVEPVSAYGYKDFVQKRENGDACDIAGRVEDNFSAKMDGFPFGIIFRLFFVPVLIKLRDTCYELNGG